VKREQEATAAQVEYLRTLLERMHVPVYRAFKHESKYKLLLRKEPNI
jgi:hypothetical protein